MSCPEKLTVRVFSARHLVSKNKDGPNAYVTIILGKDKFRTAASTQRTIFPEWNEQCELEVKKAEDVLELKVREGSETLGAVSVPVTDLSTRPGGKQWRQLLNKKGEGVGELCFDAWSSHTAKPPAPTTDASLSVEGKNSVKRSKSSHLNFNMTSLKEIIAGGGSANQSAASLPSPTATAPPISSLSGPLPANTLSPAMSSSPQPKQRQRLSMIFDTNKESNHLGSGSNSGLLEGHDDLDMAGSDGMPAGGGSTTNSPSTGRRISIVSELGQIMRGPFLSKSTTAVPNLSQSDLLEKPIITSFTPQRGSEEGGTEITITGENFGACAEDIIRLHIGDHSCSLENIQWKSPTTIVAVTPKGKGSHQIELKVAGAGKAQSDAKFTYYDPASPPEGEPSATGPEVSGISPNNGPAMGGIKVTIRGQHLGLDASDIVGVSICGVPCNLSEMTYVSESTIKVVTKPGPGGTSGPVIVTTKSGGMGRSIVDYTYNQPLKMRSAEEFEMPDPPRTPPPVVCSSQSNPVTVEAAPAVSMSSLTAGLEVRPRAESKEEEDHLSTTKLKLEIKALQKTVEKLQGENKDLKDYIDRLSIRIMETNPELLCHL